MADPTVISGARSTAGSQGIDSNSRVIDMSDTIYALDPNDAPLTAITMKMRKVKAISPKVEWLEDDYIPRLVAISALDGAGATETVTATGLAHYFRVGDLLKVLDTGELLFVQSITNANDFVVKRAVGAVAATATVSATPYIAIIGNANAEGSSARTLKTTTKTAKFNYTQIFRWEFGSTGTTQASELYGGDDLAYQTRKAAVEHRIKIEQSFLFGERFESTDATILTSNTTAIRGCGGIIAGITTNVTTAPGGVLTADVMETWLRSAMRYGPSRKMLFASRHVVSYLSQIAGQLLQTKVTDESFPLVLVEYVSPHGKIYIAAHNLLEGDGDNNHAYQGWAVLLDMDSIFYRPLGGRDTRLKSNIQGNSEDSRIDGYITEACPMLVQEQNHAILRNCTQAG